MKLAPLTNLNYFGLNKQNKLNSLNSTNHQSEFQNKSAQLTLNQANGLKNQILFTQKPRKCHILPVEVGSPIDTEPLHPKKDFPMIGLPKNDISLMKSLIHDSYYNALHRLYDVFTSEEKLQEKIQEIKERAKFVYDHRDLMDSEWQHKRQGIKCTTKVIRKTTINNKFALINENKFKRSFVSYEEEEKDIFVFKHGKLSEYYESASLTGEKPDRKLKANHAMFFDKKGNLETYIPRYDDSYQEKTGYYKFEFKNGKLVSLRERNVIYNRLYNHTFTEDGKILKSTVKAKNKKSQLVPGYEIEYIDGLPVYIKTYIYPNKSSEIQDTPIEFKKVHGKWQKVK